MELSKRKKKMTRTVTFATATFTVYVNKHVETVSMEVNDTMTSEDVEITLYEKLDVQELQILETVFGSERKKILCMDASYFVANATCEDEESEEEVE